MLTDTPPTPLTIVVLGESGVGKTCFTDMFTHGKAFIQHNPFDPSPSIRTFAVLPFSHSNPETPAKGRTYRLALHDLSSALLPPSRHPDATLSTAHMTELLATAQCIILLYDLTRRHTFTRLKSTVWNYIWSLRPRYAAGALEAWCACVAVGSRADVVRENEGARQVSEEEVEEWGGERGVEGLEVCCLDREGVEGVVGQVVRSWEVSRGGGEG